MSLTYFNQIAKFITHNNKKFKKYNYKNKNLILVELYNFKPSTIPFSYLSNVLSLKFKANIVSYYPQHENFITNLKYKLRTCQKIIRKASTNFNNFTNVNISLEVSQKSTFQELVKSAYLHL